jgi:hypothetical protein
MIPFGRSAAAFSVLSPNEEVAESNPSSSTRVVPLCALRASHTSHQVRDFLTPDPPRRAKKVAVRGGRPHRALRSAGPSRGAVIREEARLTDAGSSYGAVSKGEVSIS